MDGNDFFRQLAQELQKKIWTWNLRKWSKVILFWVVKNQQKAIFFSFRRICAGGVVRSTQHTH